MSKLEKIKASSRRMERVSTGFAFAIIVLAMIVSVGLVIDSGKLSLVNVTTASNVSSASNLQPLSLAKLKADSKDAKFSSFVASVPENDSIEVAVQNANIFDRVFSGEELCMAQAVYFEARGEPLAGQVAVAEVIKNRVSHRRFPSDACRVVFQNERRRHRCQFSFACDGKTDRPKDVASWEIALKVVHLVSSGKMTTLANTATHYHATYVKPHWRKSFNKLGQIGRHIFYTDRSV